MIIGGKLSAATGTWDLVDNATLNQRGIAAAATFIAPSAGYCTRLGAWARKVNGTPKAHFAIYLTDSSGAPTERLGRVAKQTVSAAANGANAEGAIVETDPAYAPSSTAVRLAAGQVFVIAALVEGGDVEFATVSGGSGAATHHRRTVGSGNPTDPFVASSVLAGDLWAIYADFTPDSAPSAPTLTSPSSGAALATTTPTFVGTFVDADTGSPIFDTLREYQIEVRNQAAPTVLLWGGATATFTASAAEQAAGAFTRLYAGSALTTGITYEWRARTADNALTYGAFSAWRTFTINALGIVDTATDGSPSGKVDTDPALIDWTARWHHPSGHSTNAVQVRVLQAGTVVKTGSIVTKTVANAAAPGTLFTVQDTEAGIGKLEYGVAYTYQVRGRSATDSQWSPYSAERAFSINAIPTVPTNLQPPSGASSTTRPLLEWESTDADADDVEGVDVDFTVEVTRPDTTVNTYSGLTTYDAVRGVGSLQTTATHVPVTGTYRWRVRARDTSAFNGTSEWSSLQTFVYATGPVVTVTSPTEGQVIATSTPLLTWTVTGQTKFKVSFYKADKQNAFFDSGQVVSATSEYQTPAGVLANAGNYDVVITVWNAANDSGPSLRRRFSITYAQPLPLANVTATTVANPLDVEPTSVLFTWDLTSYPPGEFAGYVVKRRGAGEAIEDALRLATLSNIGQTRWVDHHAPPNEPLVYSVSQLRKVGADTLESPAVEADVELPLTTGVLASVFDGGGSRAVLKWMQTGLSGSFDRERAEYQTWGSEGLPTVVQAAGHRHSIDAEITLMTDDRGPMMGHFNTLHELFDKGDPVSYRNESARFFVTIASLTWHRGSNVGTRVVSISLSEVDFQEGMVAT